MTNMDNEDLACKTVRDGAQDYLLKTEVDPNLLSRSIRYAIERKQAEETIKGKSRTLSFGYQSCK